MQLPIKYKIENGWLWYTKGVQETWTKGFYTYGGTKVSILNQGFGTMPEVYGQFGMKGHNGFDMYAPDGACLYAPVDGVINEVQHDFNGYGNHIKMRAKDGDQNFELAFGHLKSFLVELSESVVRGQLIGFCDNTGFSTGSHLHWGKRLLDKSLTIVNYNNGYFGSIDFKDEVSFIVEETTDLERLYQYADAKGHKYSLYFGWNGKEELAIACKKLGIIGRITQGSYYDYILKRK